MGNNSAKLKKMEERSKIYDEVRKIYDEYVKNNFDKSDEEYYFKIRDEVFLKYENAKLTKEEMTKYGIKNDILFDKYKICNIVYISDEKTKRSVFEGLYGDKKIIIKICDNSYKFGIEQINNHLKFTNMLKEYNEIPKVIDFVCNDQYSVLIEENVGISLVQYLHEHPKTQAFTNERLNLILGWKQRINDILVKIHEKKIVHRDITSSNITIMNPGTDNEQLYIIDFGIALMEGEIPKRECCTCHVAPKNIIDAGPACKEDDYNMLEYTMYALLIGNDKWNEIYHNRFDNVDKHNIDNMKKVASRIINDEVNLMIKEQIKIIIKN